MREFVGRNAILEKIEAEFSSKRGYGPHIVVLRGLGGQGKTQIALEYCRRLRAESLGAIFWVDATSVDTVKNSFRTIADYIKDHNEFIAENEVVEYILERFREWAGPWLMVFDNYDDPKSFDNIRDFLPNGEFGCLLITSRHTASDLLVSDLDSAIELEGLLEEEARDLLWKTSRIPKANRTEIRIGEAKRIIKRLAYHPLAVTQTGSYIDQQKIRLVRFMDHYDAKSVTFEVIRLRSSRISSGSHVSRFHVLFTLLVIPLCLGSNSLYLPSVFSSSSRTFWQVSTISFRSFFCWSLSSCSDRTTSTSWRIMERLRTLSNGEVSGGESYALGNILIRDIFELLRSTDEFLSDFVGKLDCRDKIAYTETEAHCNDECSSIIAMRDECLQTERVCLAELQNQLLFSLTRLSGAQGSFMQPHRPHRPHRPRRILHVGLHHLARSITPCKADNE